MHERYAVDHDFLSPAAGLEVLGISRLINAFFRWEFNSCESLVVEHPDGPAVHPIDDANACPDIAVASLHYYFLWAIGALLKWSVFCTVTGRRRRIDLETRRYFEVAASDRSYPEKMAEYVRLADEYFEADRYADFCPTALAGVDDLVRDWVASPASDSLLVDTVRTTYPVGERGPVRRPLPRAGRALAGGPEEAKPVAYHLLRVYCHLWVDSRRWVVAMMARRWWALGALALTLLVVGLDLTVLNVALPVLAADLHASTGQLQWFADGYNVVLAAALLPAGVLGDRFGRKRLLVGALVLFAAASVACAYAGSPGQLIGARAALGLGAAFLLPLSMAVLPVLFTPEERPRAVVVWATANMIGIPLGPILGGWLLDRYWWGSVFLINLPVIAAALVAVLVLLPESADPAPARFDPLGALAASLGLAVLTYGVIEIGERGWGSGAALAGAGAGVLVLGGFGWWQRRSDHPLVDLSLFGSRRFTWGALLATLASFAMFGLLFTLPQYFQAVGGTTSLGTGLRLLPIIGGLLVGARLAGRLAGRLGSRITVAAGFAVMAAALAVGATTAAGSGYGFVAGWVAVAGAGLGFALPTAMDATLSALSPQRSGAGSALVMAMRQVGGAVGVAILGAVLNAGYRTGLDPAGLPGGAVEAARRSVAAGVATAERLGSAPLLGSVRAAFVHGMDGMLLICAGAAVLGLALAAAFLPGRAGGPVGQQATEQPESGHDVVAVG
jgi:EmrB/QacA subfamily drug resistance transporter